MSNADHQLRWPAGTPVAPSGRGPGGGRFAPTGRFSPGVGMSADNLRSRLAQGDKFLVQTPWSGWAQVVSIDPTENTLTYGGPMDVALGLVGTMRRDTYMVQPDRGATYERVQDWADRVSSQLFLSGTRTPLTSRLMSHEEVASYLDRSDFTVVGDDGGAFGSVEFREYSDGTRLAYKLVEAGTSDEQIRSEVQASVVARALGAPVAAVVRDPRNPRGLLMEYIPEPDGVDGEPPPYMYRDPRLEAYEEAMTTPSGRMLGLFDLIVGNNDRHAGNVRLVDGPPITRVVGVDQGNAFRPDRYRGTRGMADPEYLINSRFYARDLLRRESDGKVHQIYYSREAIEEARRRITEIREELDPDIWWGIQQTLDSLYDMSGAGAWLD